MPYSEAAIRNECKSLGLPVDEEGLSMAQEFASKLGFTQDQFDAAMTLHARRVKTLFIPRTYPWATRFMLALHFIFNIRRW